MPLGQSEHAIPCRACDAAHDAHTPVRGAIHIKPGDVSLCFNCGTVGIVTDEWDTRQPTADEYDGLLKDPHFLDALAALAKLLAGERS